MLVRMKQLANYVYCCYASNGGTLQRVGYVGYVQYISISSILMPRYAPFFSHDLADVWHFCRLEKQLVRKPNLKIMTTKPRYQANCPLVGCCHHFGDIPQDANKKFFHRLLPRRHDCELAKGAQQRQLWISREEFNSVFKSRRHTHEVFTLKCVDFSRLNGAML